MLAASAVEDGVFHVQAADDRCHEQAFYWEVKAVRADVTEYTVEMPKQRR